MQPQIGFVAPHEQFSVPHLIDLTVLAEQAGFDAMWASDHFHPWQDNQGHAGHAWVTLSALTQRTNRILMGTGVTCPSFRNNPAIVAQAFSTISQLAPGRVFLGVGTGEALNEVPTGGGWGTYGERAERMVEAISIIRALWERDWVSFEGKYFRVVDAHLFDKPAQPIPIYVAAGGPRSARLAGMHGDGLVTVGGIYLESEHKVAAAFEEGALAAGKNPAAMPRLLEVYAVVGGAQEAREGGRLWQFAGAIDGMLDVADPRRIREIAEERTTPEKVFANWLVSTDPAAHVEALVSHARQGFTHIFMHVPNNDQERFIDFYGQHVLPAVSKATAGG